MRTTIAPAAALLTLWASLPVQAQNGSEGSPRAIYTENQARKGAETFEKYCLECHGPSDHAGPAFFDQWVGRTVFDLFDLIRSTMPNDDPGRLSRGQYTDLVAYLLQLNGLPAGKQSIPGNEDQMRKLVIEAPSRPPM